MPRKFLFGKYTVILLTEAEQIKIKKTDGTYDYVYEIQIQHSDNGMVANEIELEPAPRHILAKILENNGRIINVTPDNFVYPSYSRHMTALRNALGHDFFPGRMANHTLEAFGYTEITDESVKGPKTIAQISVQATDVAYDGDSLPIESTQQHNVDLRSAPSIIDWVNPISSTACTLKTTKIQLNNVFVIDEKRRQLYKDIDNAFAKGHNAVFLRGFGGIGKSEFARQYAAARIADGTYRTVVFAPIDVKRGNINLQTLICNDVVFSITNFPKRNEIAFFDNQGRAERKSESVDEYFARKLAKIKELCDRETLIIIDNFDVSYDSEIIRFLEGNYHVIITTRYNFPNINCPQIEVERMGHEALEKMFFEYSGRTDIQQADPSLFEIFDLLGQHTMAVEILAKYMAIEEDISIVEVLDKLKQKGSLANFDETIQISSETEEMRPFEYITALFDITSLLNDKDADNFKIILTGMSLMPLSGVKKSEFLRWCKIKGTVAVNKLIQRSWIAKNERDGLEWISMHPVVAEVMRARLKPDFCNCRNLVQSLSDIASKAYFLHTTTALYIAPILKRIIYLCPIVGIENYDIYLSFADFFANREESEPAIEILSALRVYAEENDISDNEFWGHLCRIYGNYFSFIRDSIEAANWRKKGIEHFRRANPAHDRIIDLKIKTAWNYIIDHDIPSALANADGIDTWLSLENNNTRRKGALLHLKARLEYEQGNYGIAKELESKALAIFQAIQEDGFDCGSSYYVLGLCNAKHPDTFDEGIAQLMKCLDIWREHRTVSSMNIVDLYKYIADAYFGSDRYSDAMLWYQKCLTNIDAIEDRALAYGLTPIRNFLMRCIKECELAISG